MRVFGVRTFRGKNKEKQASDCVAGLIRDIQPGVLVLEERTGNGKSFAERIYQNIGKMAEKLEIKLQIHSTGHVKRSLCGNKKATRYQVAQAVSERYCELKTYLFEKGSEKEKYWRPVFCAAALALTQAR